VLADRLGEHPTIVVQRLHAAQGYDDAPDPPVKPIRARNGGQRGSPCRLRSNGHDCIWPRPESRCR
jgi:hypothetical protein